MDTLRGNFADRADLVDDVSGYETVEEARGHDGPPPEIGKDERRMQVRAYNHWASLLQDRNFPAIDDLEPGDLPDFGPYSVLLDFTAGIEDPGISFLGEKLAVECDADVEDIKRLSDVPSRSLLTRITDHYMQIIANQAPIGFEAEFVNQRGQTILYRGILLPFSSDDDTIDFIYGVINWKEVADQKTTDELMLEIDQALEDQPAPAVRGGDGPMTDWADGPAAQVHELYPADEDVIDLANGIGEELPAEMTDGLPMPAFGDVEESDAAVPADNDEADAWDPNDELSDEACAEDDNEDEDEEALELVELVDELEAADELELDAVVVAPEPIAVADYAYGDDSFSADDEATEIVLPEIDESEMALGDWLASARELAMAARSSEDRTRNALYDAISRAYDFSLAAADAPEEFDELVADSGLTVQDRAPMTPVVKLVFGAEYDKTRLTEYAAALTHAHRLELGRGMLGDYLRKAEGGLKGVVTAERRMRKEDAGKPVEPLEAPRERLAKKLRQLAPLDLDTITLDGPEFALLMIRRTPEGEIHLLGEIPEDVALVEKAAKKLLD